MRASPHKTDPGKTFIFIIFTAQPLFHPCSNELAFAISEWNQDSILFKNKRKFTLDFVMPKILTLNSLFIREFKAKIWPIWKSHMTFLGQ